MKSSNRKTKIEKKELDTELLAKEVYGNYERLNKTLYSAYPTAFDEFNSFQVSNPTYPACYFEFFRSFDLYARFWPSDVVYTVYAGTYTYCIYFTKEIAQKLGRRSRDYRYPYISSRAKAIEKLVPKAFEIIECLLTGKEMPEKVRRM